MNEIRYRPKSNFIRTASWQELYGLTEHWKRDLDYYKDELRFFHNLVDKYFMRMMTDLDLDLFQSMVKNIDRLDIEIARLQKSIQKHLEHIQSLFGKNVVHDEQRFRNEHETLESEIEGFVKAFRESKNEIFELTEKLLREEKVKHLLSN